MKKISILLFFVLSCHVSFSQITITESNDDIVIDNYGVKNSYPKEGVNLSLRPSLLEVEYEGRTVLGVRDYTLVTNPASSSFTDLFTKVLAIIDNPSSGGGGGITEEVDPVYTASPAADITAPNITSWNTVTSKANLASPTFTGTPSLPTGTTGVTQTAGNSTTALATTAFVTTADNLKANINSQAFTGTPSLPTGTTAVTQTAGNSTTALATTAFVTTADNLKANIASPTFTGVPAAPTATGGTNTTQIATTAFVTAGLAGKLSSPGGTTAQYIRGDGTLATYVTNADYVDLTTAQSIAGNKTLSGTTTLGPAVIAGNITFGTGSTYSIGSTGTRGSAAYFNSFFSGGAVTFGTTTATSSIMFQKGTGSQNVAGFFGPSSRFWLQAAGVEPTDTGELAQINGTAKITGATTIGGDVTLSSVPALGTTATNFLTSNGGVVSSRTLAQAKTDLSIPTSTDYVDQTTNQAAIAGNKGFTGTTAMVDLNVSGTIAPNVNNTLSLGSSSNRFATVYSTSFINTSGATFGTSSASSGVYFRQGASAVYAGGFFPTSGKAFFQAQGAIPTDLGSDKQVQVYGSIALPTVSSGIYLTAPNGSIYKLTVSNAGAAVFTLQ